MDSGVFILIYLIVSMMVCLSCLFLAIFRKKKHLVLFTLAFFCFCISGVVLALQDSANIFASVLFGNLFNCFAILLLHASFRSFFCGSTFVPCPIHGLSRGIDRTMRFHNPDSIQSHRPINRSGIVLHMDVCRSAAVSEKADREIGKESPHSDLHFRDREYTVLHCTCYACRNNYEPECCPFFRRTAEQLCSFLIYRHLTAMV